MKSLRLLALVLLACAVTASAALACDAHQKKSGTSATSASATSQKGKAASGCTAEMAAQCTPAMREACEKNAAVAAAMGCSMKHGTTASTASKVKEADECCAHATGAATVGGKCDSKSTNATTAVTAAAQGCAMHGNATSATTAANAANNDHCAAKGNATTAMAGGAKCAAHQSAMTHDCEACEDWMNCEQDVRSLGAKAQVVGLKNGAMIVYTADSQADVKALQTLVAKRNERMMAALAAGSDSKLCDECKQLRGAIASGKMHREVVNVERGCMTLLTSNDRGVVQKIRAMTGQPVAMR